MVPISNGFFSFSSGHQGTSSRGFIKAQKKGEISTTNYLSKKSLVILIHSIPPREYLQFILKGYSRGSSKTIFQGSVLPQSTLEATFIQYSMDSSRTLFQSYTMGGFIQPCLCPNLARYTLHQAVDTTSRIQQRPARNSFILFYLYYYLESSKQTRSAARPQAVLTSTPRDPLDHTSAVPQLRAQLDRGPNVKGAAPSRKEGRGPRRSNSFSGVVGSFPGLSRSTFKGPGEDDEVEEENSVEEEESEGTEGVSAPVGASQGTGGPTLDQSNQTVSHQSEQSLLAIM
ncbi:hypothetical protein O181_032139 [Austropuccinia psidii MF-1]|uniref:Uncharacterized protein n=1 Tax=Austropuccinia psidii MF-1 TaxID=1389203 RepID=A0A9Q3CWX7_9BASI|nr:hypothetical protein [Austropuccinia psidii MF-1]